MWEREDEHQKRNSSNKKTSAIFETGREARRRIRKENRKINRIKQ